MCSLLGLFTIQAQTTLFSDDFDTQPISMVASSTSPTANWAISTNLKVSGTSSDSAQVSQGNTLTLESPAFNTNGFSFLSLNFNQICKIDFFDKAYVEYSINNGTSWTRFTNNEYNGTGFFNGNSFSAISYPIWNPSTGTAIPTNAWWQSESFDMSVASNQTQVKIRFVLVDADNNGARNNYGWLLDDIEIIGSSCEIIPPSISMVGTSFQGQVYGTGPYQIFADIQDASGISSAVLEYTVNGTSTNTLTMVANSSNPNEYNATIPSQAVGDTVCYLIRATDNTTCGNTASLPTTGCTEFYVNMTAPASCMGNPVNAFNYIEDFSSFTPGDGRNPGGVGMLNNNWVNPSGGFHEWWVYDQATRTTNSGPTSDHSLNDANYMYVEASGFNNQTAHLLTPCYDFSGLRAPTFSFWYHMSGNNMGELHIDLLDGNTVIADITPAIIGDQGNQWINREIDLTAYAGTIIQIRFRGITGNGFNSDIAIDDVEIREPIDAELSMTSFVTPNLAGCSGSSTELVTVNIENLGALDQDTIPVAYRVNNGPIVRDTAFFNLMVGSDFNHSFQQTFDMSSPGTYSLDAWLELPTDGNNSNDSVLGYTVSTSTIAANFPDTVTFDNFTVGTPGIFMDGWSNDPNNTFDWFVNSGSTPSGQVNTGPSGDTSSIAGTGNYIYYEANNLPQGEEGSFRSSCLNTSNTNKPEVKFFYNMSGIEMGELHLDLSVNGFTVPDIMPVISGNQGSAWIEKTVDLTPFKGDIRLIFRAVRGSGNRSDIAIDQVTFRDAQPVGIETYNLSNNIVIYPNPIIDALTITLNETSIISIFNVLGKKVFEGQLSNGSSKIDAQVWESGVYFINVENETGSSVHRFIKR